MSKQWIAIYILLYKAAVLTSTSDWTTVAKLKHKLCNMIEPDDGLLDHLRSLEVLLPEEYDDIRTERTVYKINSKLLEVVMKHNEQSTYNNFLKALTGSGQQHIVNFITDGGEVSAQHGNVRPLSDVELRRINANRPRLIEQIDPSNRLLDRMAQLGCISLLQQHDITETKKKRDKNRELLDIMCRRSVADLNKFIACLAHSGQAHLIYLFTEDAKKYAGISAKMFYKVGNTVRLSCYTNFDEPVDWRYQRNTTLDEEYVCTSTDQGVTNCEHYSRWPRIGVNASTPGDYTLTIYNVTVNDSGLYHCVEEGGTGMRHTTQVNVSMPECTSYPCQNHGTCKEGVYRYTCVCSAGFTGTDCDSDLNECLSEPCQNGGRCINEDNAYACICRPGVGGTNCEEDVNECSSEPCQNDGRCFNEDNAYACICHPGFGGTNCEDDLNECLSEPCQNGGQCINGDNEYTCGCPPEFAGINCETVVIKHELAKSEVNVVYISVFTTLGVAASVVVVVASVITAVLVIRWRRNKQRLEKEHLLLHSQGVTKGALTCPVCFDVFLAEPAGYIDRRPLIICYTGHTVCADCYNYLEENEFLCPTCDDTPMSTPIFDRALLARIEEYVSADSMVSVTEVTQHTVFESGAFAAVYNAKWHSLDVAVKVLRSMPEDDKQTKQLQIEVNLVIGLNHPNIVRLFGTTQLSGGQFGFVVEKIDRGSLDQRISSLDRQTATSIALGVIDGLEYIHSRNIAHRDLKPQNILLSGPQLIPKVADLGVSKVIRTNPAMDGTRKYAAPELLSPGCTYGWPVDIFSLSIIMFEMFSHLPAEKELDTNDKEIKCGWVQGMRPKIPDDFPVELSQLVEQGWAENPMERTSLDLFRSALELIFTGQESTMSQSEPIDTKVSMEQQAKEVAKSSLPMPMLSLNWNSSCEVLNSQELRNQMVDDIQGKSTMKEIVNESVLSVLKVVPRHLFVEKTKLENLDQQEILNLAYRYNKPIPATMSSNESAPEIIGTQLSMTEILQGQSVLLVGIKGGYIQSLVAQLVGRNGYVATVTSDDTAMKVCQERVNVNCPFKDIVDWIKVTDVKDAASIVDLLPQSNRRFNTVIYCGSVDRFPLQLIKVLHPVGNVSIMAPVNAGVNKQLFRLYVRRGCDPAELRTISDFGVLFGKIT